MRIMLSPERASVLRREGRVAFVVEGEIAFEPWRHCTEQCVATESCEVCERRFPPAGRDVAIEMYGSYCDRECAGWDDDRRRSKHLWPGEFATLERRPPATWVALDRKVVLAATNCDREHDAFQIDSCWCNGTVIVDAVTVRVLPVLHWSDNDEEAPPCVSVGHSDGKVFACVGLYGGIEVALDTAPRPGVDWVVVLTVSSDGSPSARSDDAVQGGGAA